MNDIEALSFDADGTLWDFDATMRRSLGKAIEFLAERDGRLAGLTVDGLIDARQEIARRRERDALSMETLRFLAFEEALRRRGSTNERLVDEVTTFYLAERFADPILFDGVVETLEILAERFELVLVSNGNSDPERCGLAGVFSATLFADQLGISKPDPRIYEHLLLVIGRNANQVVHVGDSLVNDVDAAGRIGIGTVWLNRFDQPPSDGLLPPRATIRSLAELPTVLDRWSAVG